MCLVRMIINSIVCDYYIIIAIGFHSPKVRKGKDFCNHKTPFLVGVYRVGRLDVAQFVVVICWPRDLWSFNRCRTSLAGVVLSFNVSPSHYHIHRVICCQVYPCWPASLADELFIRLFVSIRGVSLRVFVGDLVSFLIQCARNFSDTYLTLV